MFAITFNSFDFSSLSSEQIVIGFFVIGFSIGYSVFLISSSGLAARRALTASS